MLYIGTLNVFRLKPGPFKTLKWMSFFHEIINSYQYDFTIYQESNTSFNGKKYCHATYIPYSHQHESILIRVSKWPGN